MKFSFFKPACQNIRRSLRKEWLQTNGLGDYSSSTVPLCNTRKYHGLLVANLPDPPGRHVLLSSLEESVAGGDKEFFFSTRKHPGAYYPHGYEYLEYMESGNWTIFRYRIGPLLITRELCLVQNRTMLLIRYSSHFPDGGEGIPPLSLRIKPQLAFRNMHELTFANMALQVSTFPAGKTWPGFLIRPYNSLPAIYMQSEGVPGKFFPSPDWCHNVEYFVEQERGFPAHEDLFMPGMFELDINPDTPVFISASLKETSESLATLWEEETSKRLDVDHASSRLTEHLRQEGKRFLTNLPSTERSADGKAKKATKAAEMPAVVAGYHWFNAWGRDSLIALPGLTFAAGRPEEGKTILAAISKSAKQGLVPNLFAFGASPAAYNSVDASLWYIWAVQKMLELMPDEDDFTYAICWPVIKSIISAYKNGGPLRSSQGIAWPPMRMDDEGLLVVGNEHTQLTWMDANSDGYPVTPRHGCPVEINALWYNALVFARQLAERFGEDAPHSAQLLSQVKDNFRKRFWTDKENGYLGDVWRDGWLDASIRPNQIFAVSMPCSVLDEEDMVHVVECVRNNLLTPYGLRTLSPQDPAYKEQYEGGPGQRDAAYHQGTVWPWLLGPYGEALLKAAWDINGAVEGFLNEISPLFTHHLGEEGLGSISEIFSGNPPHSANGCIAQAWSVAECCRVLRLMQEKAPAIYAAWEDRMDRGIICAF